MTTNGNGWKDWVLKILLGIILTLSLFGTVQIQGKADKYDVNAIETRLVKRDDEIKNDFLQRVKEIKEEQARTNELLLRLLQKEK